MTVQLQFLKLARMLAAGERLVIGLNYAETTGEYYDNSWPPLLQGGQISARYRYTMGVFVAPMLDCYRSKVVAL